MQDLVKLVKIVTQLKQRQFPLLEMKGLNEGSSKENVFFRYVKKGEVKTDDEAAELLYGSDSYDDRYRMLKSRLKQKLLNHVYFLDLSNKQGSNAKFYEQECLQLIHQGRTLMLTDELKIAKSLFQKAHTVAQRCEFNKYLIETLEELLKIFSQNCQPHLYDNTIEELEQVRKLYAMDLEAEMLYYKYRMLLVKSVNSRKKHIEETEEILEKLKAFWNDSHSYSVFEFYNKLNFRYKCICGEYQDLIDGIKEMVRGEFEGVKLNEYRLDTLTFKLDLLYLYMRLKWHDEGVRLADELSLQINSKNENYFKYADIYFLLLMQHKDYEMALSLLTDVMDSKRYAQLDESEKNKWKLYLAYTHFVQAGNFYQRNFNFSSITEAEIDESHDEPYNAAVLILQFMYYLEKSELEELVKRRDVLKKYMANHFKENFSYRTRTFYKLLNIVVESNTDLKKIQSKSKYLFAKLEESPVVSDAFQEIEIVPYETLWQMIIDMLKFERALIWS